jgi:hypothetical protein
MVLSTTLSQCDGHEVDSCAREFEIRAYVARNSIETEAGITVLLSTESSSPSRFETRLEDVIQEAHRGEPFVRVVALDNAIAPAEAGDG